jgi:beta-glucosidase
VQQAFVAQVLSAAKARGTPVVMVLVNAGQIAVDTLPTQPDALVEAFYPAFGAPALAKQLFGLSNRWGRLPYTMYESAFAEAIPLSDMNVSGTVGRTWRYYKGAPNYRFGDGLGYSNFTLACGGEPSSVPADRSLALSINCSSSFSASSAGLTEGDEILLVVHRVGADVLAAVGRKHPIPAGSLRAFERITLAQGAGAVATSFSFGAADLALITATGAEVLYPGTHFLDVLPRPPGTAFTLPVVVTGTTPLVLSQPPPLPPPRA